MVPQGTTSPSPIRHLGGSSPFALFSTDNPAVDSSGFDGVELLALEPSGGKSLEVCGLTPGGDYIARWLRPIDATGFGRPIQFRVPAEDQAPGNGSSKHCRRLVNPDSGSSKLLHLRRTAELE